MLRSPLPSRNDLAPDTPLRLNVAAALAFPDGSMTTSGLRREFARGRLVIERIAGKDYTTLANIERMRELCRVPQKELASGFAPKSGATMGPLRKRAVWVIRDGPRKISTGCAAEDREGADRALGQHLANKYQPARTRGRHPSEILIADVLTIYLIDVGPKHARENETKQRVLTLEVPGGVTGRSHDCRQGPLAYEGARRSDRRRRHLYDGYAVQEAGLKRRSTISHPRVEPHDLASFGAASV